MAKTIELDTGIELIGFNKKKIDKLIKKGKKFRIELPAVISRDMLYLTIKVKRKELDIVIYCNGLDDDDGSQNAEYTCKKSAKKLESLIAELLFEMYT